MWFMGIDMGTSGCKAVVFDERWQIAAQAYREYPMHFPGEGLLELDAELVWQAICAVIREANDNSAQPVGALAVSAIGDVIIPVDRDGTPVRRSIIDFDPRGGDQIRRFSDAYGRQAFFDRSGMPPLYIGSLAKILWIQEYEPDVFAAAARWATYEDFLVQRLGLPPTASESEAARTMLFDLRQRDWADDLLRRIPLTREQLPAAVPSGTVIGQLPAAMQRSLGFRAPVTVVAGGHDMVCAAVGAGLDETHPEEAVDIAGTIEGLVCALPQANTCPAMLENCFPCYPATSGYVTFSVNLTAGCIVRWYRDRINPEEAAWCKANGKNFYDYMQRRVDPAAPGSLLFLPHFSGSGNPFFCAEALGAIYGLTLDTTREDIARAMVEGLAYELRLHQDALANAGIRLKSIRAVGGGAAIDRQLQLKANITGLRVIKGAVAESSALGAAAYAAYGVGALQNPAHAYRVVQAQETVFEPDTAAHARFSPCFEQYRHLAYAIHGLDMQRAEQSTTR